ncbi:PKD-like family lipoprotein [Pedobacter sp. GR22-6]|uniref:PKD-like family lipoprotein n=1 Tax=Pedobacter sp. GR22-6 TaxID=3127957 RepID=UPI00307EEA00
MKKYNLITFFLLAVLYLSACKQSEMELHEINEGSISGLATNYEVIYKAEELKITPNINWTQDATASGNYSYSWKVIPVATPTAAGTIIGTERDLKTSVELNPGDYNLYYRVTDNNTNVAFSKTATLRVTTVVSRGFLVFGDDNSGNADLQMIAMRANGQEFILKNLLSGSGLPVLKGAKEVYFSGSLPQYNVDNRKLWITTNDGAYYIDRTTFRSDPSQTLKSFSFFSQNLPEPYAPILFAPISINGVQVSGVRAAIWSNGYLNKNENVTYTTPESYGDWINHVDNVFFRLSPYIAYSPLTTGSSLVFFDKDNKRFVYNSNYYYNMIPLTTGSIFPWDQRSTQRDLVYMENTVNTENGAVSGNSYALLKDPSNRFHIYKFYPRTRLQVAYYQPTFNLATDLDKATKYAFYSNRSYLFYAVGSKLYGYEYSSGNEKVKLIRDFGTEEISLLKFDIQNTSTGANDLYVATYSASSGGTLRKLTVQNNPNDIVASETKSWSGLNKISSIYWRND